ncbi:hypothetical protein T492DRAFT_1034122 [Pavlovales sp. CCMP2436]|nr:hypothetical protein T492DRAFT_1034122 [Pavlovales sp. CCMP2436]
MASSWLLFVAAVITLIALLVGGYSWWLEQQHSAGSFIEELDHTGYMSELELETPEREVYDKMAEAYAMDPPRVSIDQLSSALLRRAIAVVPFIERVEKDRPSVAKLSKNGYIPAEVVEEVCVCVCVRACVCAAETSS